MRKLIAAMKVSADMKCEGPEGVADWVAAWSDDYDLTPQIDACLLGGGMYSGYERHWLGVQAEPDSFHWAGRKPTPQELDWVRFAAKTPHYVLSSTLTSPKWPGTSVLRGLDEVAALKRRRGKDIYLVGGARTTAGLVDAGLVDELRLLVYPLIAGPGKALFSTTERRRGLELRKVDRLEDGRVSLVYAIQ
jgi:dihydrofolate reductase